jgi:hypothetical protein
VPLHEPETHTFLVRVWIEATIEETRRIIWRGQITHLPDERRQYVHEFEEIRDFIGRYLMQEGIGRGGGG